MGKNIENIISKFFRNSISNEELELLLNFILKDENYNLFNEYVQINYLSNLSMNQSDKTSLINELESRIKKSKKQAAIKLFVKNLMRVAAVFVGILGVAYFLNYERILIESKNIILTTSSGEKIIVSEADEVTGTFMVALPMNSNYAISVTYEGYHPYSLNFDLSEENDSNSYHIDIPMNKPVEVSTMSDSASRASENIFKNVFFDLNRSKLRAESQIELDLFAQYLIQNDKIKIELGGHTDSRGDENKNITLSEARAKSVYSYLIKKGITATRMTYKGYGSSTPIFSNAQISQMKKSSEKEAAHQHNRRTVWRETL